MRRSDRRISNLVLFLSLAGFLSFLSACGGGNNSNSNSNPPPPPSGNTEAISVNFGPAGNYVNGLFASVTVCDPGSSACQTIPNVLVDTGSEGLRVLSSALTLGNLPSVDVGGNPLQECVSFADGSYLWGPVVTADVQLAGETASSVPIQIISASPAVPAPSSCNSGGGTNSNTVAALGANGILGVGNFRHDCGTACTASSTAVPNVYFTCPNSSCSVTSADLTSQVQNPVWLLPSDNNGVLISLPSVPASGAVSASGSLIFGVGTQSDNMPGASQQLYTTDGSGNIQTTYAGTAYTSFIDSGSNAMYFLDHSTLGITECSDAAGFYCPSSTQSYTVTNTGQNGTSSSAMFNIANADTLFSANGGNDAALVDLGGDSGTSPSTDYFDFGIPFFYGRNVFVGINGTAGPGGITTPYWIY